MVCLVAEKVKEKERKWEKRKAVGKTPAQDFINGEDHVTMLVWGFYSQTPFTNYKNNIANTITMGAKKEENQKVTKRSQKVKKHDDEQWLQDEQW